MADFSELARPSKEWQHHVEVYGTPLPAPIGKMSPVAMQKSTNDGRDEASSRQIIEEGNRKPCFLFETFSPIAMS
jgi:hypothetical protein